MKRTSAWLLALTTSAFFALAVLPAGCSGSTLAAPPSTTEPDPDAGATGIDDAAVVETDGSIGRADSSTPPGGDAAPPVFADGTPTRVACTSALGSGLSPAHGRLDGTLVSIVPASGSQCPSDSSHLHLQVRMKGASYDIAVNLDGFEGEIDAPLPGVPFSEGWHPMDLDYVADLGLHSSDLTVTTPQAIRSRVVTQLTNANHISVFGTGYPGSDGAHLIHRKATAHDGALVINPLAGKAHVIAFRFVTDTF